MPLIHVERKQHLLPAIGGDSFRHPGFLLPCLRCLPQSTSIQSLETMQESFVAPIHWRSSARSSVPCDGVCPSPRAGGGAPIYLRQREGVSTSPLAVLMAIVCGVMAAPGSDSVVHAVGSGCDNNTCRKSNKSRGVMLDRVSDLIQHWPHRYKQRVPEAALRRWLN